MINDNIIKLPSLPPVVQKINQSLNDQLSLAEVASLIQADTTISSRVLQIANSAALRGNTKIITIKDAISRIGLVMVKNLVVTIMINDQGISYENQINDGRTEKSP